MTNNSATGGYLLPSDATPPLEGDDLLDFFNDLIAGITGLDGDKNIIPAWSEEPPNLPDRSVTWCAIRITTTESPYAEIEHTPGDDTNDPPGNNPGSDTLTRQQTLALECSFYGPGADAAAGQFRDGLFVAQNREVLFLNAFGLVNVGPAQAIPSLIKQKWLYRTVLTATFRREITRTYPVLDLKSAGGTVNTEAITDTFEASKD